MFHLITRSTLVSLSGLPAVRRSVGLRHHRRERLGKLVPCRERRTSACDAVGVLDPMSGRQLRGRASHPQPATRPARLCAATAGRVPLDDDVQAGTPCSQIDSRSRPSNSLTWRMMPSHVGCKPVCRLCSPAVTHITCPASSSTPSGGPAPSTAPTRLLGRPRRVQLHRSPAPGSRSGWRGVVRSSPVRGDF